MKEKNVLFFWIPKTAGTTIYEVSKKNQCKKLKKRRLYKYFNNEGWVTFGHISIPFLLRKKIISKQYLNEAFKFCFVRNPWDRLVSIYKYKRYDGKMSFEEFVFLIEKRIKKQNTYFGKFMDFIHRGPIIISRGLEFIIELLNLPTPLPKVGKYNEMGLHQANPQTAWIVDENNRLLVDFIGRFENLEEDIKNCFEIAGMDVEDIPHLNKTNHKNYRSYYSKKTRKIVEDLYYEDIKQFKYKF